MRLNKAQLKKLPKITGQDADRQMDYVHSVLSGKEKFDALKEHFPEMYELAVERANGNERVLKANITSQVNILERKNNVKKMYEVAHKNAWTNFVAKKHKLYENLYGMAMDENNSVRDRASCSKTLLDHMPKFEEDKTITVEVKDNRQDFIAGLRDMQIALHKQANKEAIDVEIDEN